ncbi:hypothetical protein [Alcanivorax jadensis]|uniref:hypothetical protein n=1 Tax=Alcanivorax jadensis TaxID=64988 RepID=UPI0023527A8A|nr:hypothetical protein [Alcanivorax jadensis]
MGTVLNQVSFASGELSPRLLGRVDISRWQSGLSTCRNFIPRPYGGIENRPGFQFLQECEDSDTASRLLPFQFSTVQTYVLELGDGTMRFYKDGGIILDGGLPLVITTPWSESEIFDLKYTQSADVMYFVHIGHPPMMLRRTAVDEFELVQYEAELGPFLPQNIDETVAIYASAAEGIVTLTATEDLFEPGMVGSPIKLGQDLDVAIKAWEVAATVSPGDKRAASGHYYEANSGTTTGTLRPDHIEGVQSDGGVTWRYLHSGFGVAIIRQYNSPTEVLAEVTSRLPDSVVGSEGSTMPVNSITFVESADNLYFAKIDVTGHGISYWEYFVIDGATGPSAAYVNGVHKAGAITTNTINYTDTILQDTTPSVDITNATFVPASSGGEFSRPTYRWSLGAWSEVNGFPSTANFFQQRLVFAATEAQPQTFWMSVIDAFASFEKHEPLLNDDSIEGTIAARQVNTIKHIVALNDLIFNTSGAEWKMTAGDAGIVPGSVTIDAQSFYGSSDVTPITTGTVALFVQEKGGIVRDLGYSFDVDGYSGSNLSQLSEHLFRGRKVKDWAYSQVPWDCVFLVMSDGALLTLTYVRDQQVIGWARHDTDGFFESVTSVSEGDEDAIYAVIRRNVGGQDRRYVERLHVRDSEDIEKAFFVDSGLTYDGNVSDGRQVRVSGDWGNEDYQYTVTGLGFTFYDEDVGDAIFVTVNGEEYRLTILRLSGIGEPSANVEVVANKDLPEEGFSGVQFDDWCFARNRLTGLDHLEGKDVSVLADGNVHPVVTVTDGAIELQYPACIVHAGLAFESEMKTLPISSMEGSVRDKLKNVRKVSMIVQDTRGGFYSAGGGREYELKPEYRNQWDIPVPLRSGLAEIMVDSIWGYPGIVTVKQKDPLPMSILSIMPDVTMGGAS